MSFHRWEGADLILSVHVQPGAKRTEVAGLHGDALKIRLHARPVEGAANAALIEFLADALQVPRRSVELVHGAQSREKRLRVRGAARGTADAVVRAWGGSVGGEAPDG